MRAIVSVGPPGANGTMIVIGRAGKAYAFTAPSMTGTAPVPAAKSRKCRREIFMRFLPGIPQSLTLLVTAAEWGPKQVCHRDPARRTDVQGIALRLPRMSLLSGHD